MAGRSRVGACRSRSLVPLMWKAPIPPTPPVRGFPLSKIITRFKVTVTWDVFFAHFILSHMNLDFVSCPSRSGEKFLRPRPQTCIPHHGAIQALKVISWKPVSRTTLETLTHLGTVSVSSVADPGSWTDAVETPGSGIQDPGWVKNQDPDLGRTTRIIFPKA
jgi:hypothetical protein